MEFNHPDADNYVAAADTHITANLFADYSHLGNLGCLGCKELTDLWFDKIIPGYAERGVTGIEWDEGPNHHGICDNPKHLHGNKASEILSV
jgi:hypothetical protein